MSDSLLEQFLTQECTPHVRRMLESALLDMTTTRPRLELNRFEVTIDRDSEMVVIEDVLDASEAGVQRVSLVEFVNALDGCSA